MKELLNEKDFNTVEEFYDYCTRETGVVVNSYTLNSTFPETNDVENNVISLSVTDSYIITFDSGGYTLFKKQPL